MTELEQQLMRALRTLSAQSEAERQALQQRFERQAAQNETLRRQVEQLAAHVTRLDRDYTALAETLRGRWN